ncbi:MAG: hypothetical protein ACKVOK_04475 [Flavobacteriales bacterium]
MKQFIIHLLFFAALCVVLHNCKHEPVIDPNGPQCGEATTIDELREWAFFKEGTYWIYEEETTLARDTFTVVDSHDFITD